MDFDPHQKWTVPALLPQLAGPRLGAWNDLAEQLGKTAKKGDAESAQFRVQRRVGGVFRLSSGKRLTLTRNCATLRVKMPSDGARDQCRSPDGKINFYKILWDSSGA
jgi:hypothetical protein